MASAVGQATNYFPPERSVEAARSFEVSRPEVSRADSIHIASIHRAINFIEEHLDRPLYSEEVALCAGFSEYHFHRIFSEVLGESVKEYILRRRLTCAAMRIQSTAMPIIDVAYKSGFKSQEAFTRAFQKIFGVAPGRYRRWGTSTPYSERVKAQTTIETIRHIWHGRINKEPSIVYREAEYVVGIGKSFPNNSFEEVKKLWRAFRARKSEVKYARPGYEIGIDLNSHPDIEKGKGHSFIYIAGVPVSATDQIPEGMVKAQIFTSNYARFTHQGPITDLRHSLTYIWGTWVPKRDSFRTDCPDFELFDERFDRVLETGEFDMYFPVRSI
jgi:AraC family transcriptional regulator